MKKIGLIISVIILFMVSYVETHADSSLQINNVMDPDGIIISTFGLDSGINIKKAANNSEDVKKAIAKKLGENDKAIVFDLVAYNNEEEQIDFSNSNINVIIKELDKTGYGGFGKDYRVFKIQDETFEQLECTGDYRQVSFNTENVGTFAFVYNAKAFPIYFYSEYDAVDKDNNVLFYKTEDLTVKDTVFAPNTIPQKEGYVFGGWVDTARKSIPLIYKEYVGKRSSYCANWIPENDFLGCDANDSGADIEITNNDFTFDSGKRIYFLDELSDGEIVVKLNNPYQYFRIYASNIDIDYYESDEPFCNPEEITFAVPQDDETKRIDIHIYSANLTNHTSYSIIVNDSDEKQLTADGESTLNISAKGYCNSIPDSEYISEIKIKDIEIPIFDNIDYLKNKVVAFKTEPFSEAESLEHQYVNDVVPTGNIRYSLKMSDDSDMGTEYAVYKLENNVLVPQNIISSDLQNVIFYADGFGEFLIIYEPQSYEVKFINEGSEYLKLNLPKGSGISIPEQPQKSGYTFKGWYSEENGNGIELTEDVLANKYMTFYAFWKKNSSGGRSVSSSTCLIHFNSNGGSAVKDISVKKNSSLTLPDNPIKEGYLFAGWYKDKALTETFKLDEQITSSITLYAKWDEIHDDNSKNEIVLTIGNKAAKVWGNEVINDVAPIIRNDRTMLPARFVAESLGASVEWYEDEQKVRITKENTEILLFINSDIAKVNGEDVILDSPAFIENDRTYTPLRFVAERLGAYVKWDDEKKSAVISLSNFSE